LWSSFNDQYARTTWVVTEWETTLGYYASRVMEMAMVQSGTLIKDEEHQSDHHHPNIDTRVLKVGYPSCCSTNSIKALKAKFLM